MAVLAAVALAPACAGGERGPARAPAPAPTPSPALPVVRVEIGRHAVLAEVAGTPQARQRGLMHRTHLDPDAGMLFVFPAPLRGGFWMKDTLIPLSIAYLRREPGGYRIVAILDMEPCRAEPCPTYQPAQEYDAALEVNRGWFAARGIVVGDRAVVKGALPRPT